MKNSKMTIHERREIAHGAARSILRAYGYDPRHCTVKQALAVLDDMARHEPKMYASVWYMDASDSQMKLFKTEWKHYTEESKS